MIQNIYSYFEYASLVLTIFFYARYKHLSFYKYFLGYLISSVFFETFPNLYPTIDKKELFNIYTFFEFNFFALIYYNLLKENGNIKVIKIFFIFFNLVYLVSFFLIELKKYTVILEAIINSIFILIYFKELLNSERVLNYKRLLPFWISVGFLIFYLTTIPFFTLFYFDLFYSLSNLYNYM